MAVRESGVRFRALGFVIAIAIEIAIGVLSYHRLGSLVRTSELVSHTDQVIRTLDLFLLEVRTGDSRRRGSVLVGEPRSPDEEQFAVATMRRTLSQLQRLTIDNAAQQRRIRDLAPAIELAAVEWLALREVVSQRGLDVRFTAEAIASADRRVAVIATIVAQMRAEEERLRRLREIESRATSSATSALILAGGSTSVFLLLFVFWLISREIAQRRRAQASLRAEVEERIRREIALERANDLAQRANKELEAFSYSVSHDLRAPLRAIDGFSQALLEDHAGALDESGRDFLDRVRAATQRMGLLIDDLLSLSRVSRGSIERVPVDLSAMVRSIEFDLKRADAGRDVELAVADGVMVDADPRLMRVALENLLANAWKFTARLPRAHIQFGVSESVSEPAYFVRDDGAGFDPVHAAKLFGAFQRLHSAAEFPGTGIGLATVQRILARHGGRIWAEGAVGAGATFHFTVGVGAEAHEGDS